MSETVVITDVGPRDGLQNQPQVLSVEQRLQLNKLIAESLEKRDAFTTEADVRYFVTDDYLDELNSDE